MPSLVMVK